MLNMDCVRDLLLTIDKTQVHHSNGKGKPWKLRKHLDDEPLSSYPRQEVFDAAKYIFDEGMIDINALTPADAKLIAPRSYVIHAITSKGYKFLEAIRKDDIWTRLKSIAGDIAKWSAKAIIEEAAKILLHL